MKHTITIEITDTQQTLLESIYANEELHVNTPVYETYQEYVETGVKTDVLHIRTRYNLKKLTHMGLLTEKNGEFNQLTYSLTPIGKKIFE